MRCKKVTGTRKAAVLSQIRQEKTYRAIQAVQKEHHFSVIVLCQIEQIPR